MYDWANSVYNLVITSTIFPAYYESMTGDGNDATMNDKVVFLGREFVNTSLYNYALAIAFFIVAIMSPFLSSIADYRGNKKSFLRFFMTMGNQILHLGYYVPSLPVSVIGQVSFFIIHSCRKSLHLKIVTGLAPKVFHMVMLAVLFCR